MNSSWPGGPGMMCNMLECVNTDPLMEEVLSDLDFLLNAGNPLNLGMSHG